MPNFAFYTSIADLPGFYYDAQKNRYFPLKGPIPGCSRTSSSSSSAPHHKRVSNSTPVSTTLHLDATNFKIFGLGLMLFYAQSASHKISVLSCFIKGGLISFMQRRYLISLLHEVPKFCGF